MKGTLKLGKGTFIKGNVKADEAIIGSNSEIKGNVEVSGELRILDTVEINGSAVAGKEMLVRPGCKIKFARQPTQWNLLEKSV